MLLLAETGTSHKIFLVVPLAGRNLLPNSESLTRGTSLQRCIYLHAGPFKLLLRPPFFVSAIAHAKRHRANAKRPQSTAVPPASAMQNRGILS